MAYFKLPDIRVHLFGYIFSPRLIPTLATFALLPLLIGLGVWQLHRATEKKQIERDFALHSIAIDLRRLPETIDKRFRYQTLQATGKFDNEHTVFLDNKTYKQRIGYHVFTPFYIKESNRFLLIDRGFIATLRRDQLPPIPLLSGTRSIRGLIYFPSKMLVLKKEDVKISWPLVVQTINLPELSRILHQPTYPFYLLLQSGEESKLIKDWHPVNFPSYRHTGYAIQWFSLALTLLVIYIILNCSRDKDDQC